MDLGLNEQQKLFSRTAREFLEAECPISLVRELEDSKEGYSLELWQKMAALGWLGLAIPVDHGGDGGNLMDQTVLFEEIGRAMVPGPLLASSAYVVRTILGAGSDEQKSRILPQFASGDTTVTTILAGQSLNDGRELSLRATIDGQGYALEGTAIFMPYADSSDMMLCVAGSLGQTESTVYLTLFLVARDSDGLTTNAMPSIGDYRQHEVRFRNVRVGPDATIGQVGGAATYLAPAQQWATVLQCADIVGRSEKILEMVVEYSKNRVQFGRPIGSFQAVQHQCADLRTAVDGARMATYHAAWKVDNTGNNGTVRDASEEVAVAKAYAGSLSRLATAVGHGIFAGIAFTVEHDMQLYSMRSKIAEANMGDTDHHLEQLAVCMGL